MGSGFKNPKSGRRGCGGLIGALIAIFICLACLAALAIGYYLVSQGIITIPGITF